MDIGSAIRLLLRRWLIVLIGALLTLGVCAYLYRTAEPRYQAAGRMLLLLPSNARGEEIGSPFLYLPNGLNVLARVVSSAPDSREVQRAMAEAGLHSQFEVGVDPTTPILSVTVEGTDPDNVIATRDWLVEFLNQHLLQVQEEEGTPARQTAHTRLYEAEDIPHRLGGDWTRSVMAALAAGGIATLLAAFGTDRLLALRASRLAARRSVDDTVLPDDPVPPDEGPLTDESLPPDDQPPTDGQLQVEDELDGGPPPEEDHRGDEQFLTADDDLNDGLPGHSATGALVSGSR